MEDIKGVKRKWRRVSSIHSAGNTSKTKKAKAKDKRGELPDQNLQIDNNDHLTAGQVKQRLKNLSGKETKQIQQYEKKHKNRITVLSAIES